jgi:hypothetical protein
VLSRLAALPDSGDLLDSLTRVAGFADRPALAWIAADKLESRLYGHRAEGSGLLATANALADGGPAAAQFAASIAGKAGERAGWPAQWRDLVTALRGHADPDVRLRALRAVIPTIECLSYSTIGSYGDSPRGEFGRGHSARVTMGGAGGL